MVFSSLEFIFIFLTVFLLIYYITPKPIKNFVLLSGSLLFYSYGNLKQPAYILLMLLSILVNYLLGRIIDSAGSAIVRKRWLIIGLFYNFSWLFLFKYLDFFIENINALLHGIGFSFTIPQAELVLPIGISFYTFQIVSYLADVYRHKTKSEESVVRLGVYLCMFPQLIAGPIVSYPEISASLKSRKVTAADVEDGLRTFVMGLGMKVLLANQLGRLWNEVNTIGFESISTQLAWLGIIAFSLQIYFDFYGYSLMAIGLGKLMGFQLPVNFRHPYAALSMTDFWRRWHITLGSWFREYVYIPLGGSRNGRLNMIRNTVIVWLCTGIWHGASWNFVLWGIVLCLLILIEKAGLLKLLKRFPVIGHAYMCMAIPVSWLFFAVTDMGQIKLYLYKLFPFLGTSGKVLFAEDYLKYGKIYAVSLLVGLLFATPLPARLYQRYRQKLPVILALFLIFWLSVYCLYIGMDDPFLYFRF